jgi:hypothetical protein
MTATHALTPEGVRDHGRGRYQTFSYSAEMSLLV